MLRRGICVMKTSYFALGFTEWTVFSKMRSGDLLLNGEVVSYLGVRRVDKANSADPESQGFPRLYTIQVKILNLQCNYVEEERGLTAFYTARWPARTLSSAHRGDGENKWGDEEIKWMPDLRHTNVHQGNV